MRVLFGHQSVGANLIDGLRALSPRDSAPLQILESRAAPDNEPDVLCHFRVGRNHDAQSKLADFTAAVTAGGSGFDLALFKFCYVDVTDAAGADALFVDYKRAMAALQEKMPELKLGHVTVPLRAAPAGMVSFIHGTLLRRSHPEHARNAARERFNDRLRAEYPGEVFDLAALEARGANGHAHRWRQHGVDVAALAPALTDDGGHLNAAGQRIAAQAFLAYLAVS